MKLFGVIPVYGLLIVLGTLIAVLSVDRIAKKRGLPEDLGIDLALVCMPLAILCARLYYVAFRWEHYAQDPVSILRVWEGGLAIYGGIIGGIIGGVIVTRHKKIPFFSVADIVAPFLILAQGIGRWGNFANGEAHGQQIVSTALQFFPFGVQIDGVWYQATFFYESVWDIIGFLVLLLYTVLLIRLFPLQRAREETRRGTASVLYLTWYAAGRAVIEGLRTDSLYIPGTGIRVSQALSVLLLIAGCAHFLCVHIKSKKAAAAKPAADTEAAK